MTTTISAPTAAALPTPPASTRVRRPSGWRAAWLIAAGIAAIVSVFPFAFMILGSLKTSGEFLANPFGLPQNPTLDNFVGVLTSQFGRYFLNSVVVTVVSVALTVGLGILAAYPLSRMRVRLNGPVTLLFLAGIMVPVHVTLIPTYVLAQDLGTYDSLAAVIGPYVAFNLPVAVFILIGFFQQIPESLFDAAKLDGAGDLAILRNVVMPMAGPAIATVCVITFIFVWNEFVFALVLISTSDNYLLPLGLNAFYGQYRVDIPGMMAALFLATLPSIAFYVLAQERVVSGLAAGALRGE